MLAAQGPSGLVPMPLGPHFEENAAGMLSTVKERMAGMGVPWPAEWPDPTARGHGGRPVAPATPVSDPAEWRRAMASVSRLMGQFSASNQSPAGLKYLQLMLPTFLLWSVPPPSHAPPQTSRTPLPPRSAAGYASPDLCIAFITGTTIRHATGDLGAEALGVQPSSQRLARNKRKGRCSDRLPPAPPPPPIPPPLPSAYETRGISWKGHLLLPSHFAVPRGARLDATSAASKTATLWPASVSPQAPGKPHRPDLGVTAVERADALEYAVGPKGPLAAGSKT